MQLEKRAQKRWQTGNEGQVGCQPRNTANLPHVVLVSCEKTGCLLGSKSEQSENEGNRREKREIDGKAVKTSSRVAVLITQHIHQGTVYMISIHDNYRYTCKSMPSAGCSDSDALIICHLATPMYNQPDSTISIVALIPPTDGLI
jgi:hypothetical protein